MAYIRVVVIEDCPPTLEGLRVILAREADITVVGEACSGREGLHLVGELAPDVVLLDVNLPDMDGLVVLRRLREAYPEVRVLMVSAYLDAKYVCGALLDGAAGYVYKDERLRELGELVRRVARGEQLWTKEQVAQARHWQEVEDKLGRLTGREREVLGLVAQGKGNQAIASLLSLTKHTVEYHLSNILRKLRVASRLEAALWVKEHRLEERLGDEEGESTRKN